MLALGESGGIAAAMQMERTRLEQAAGRGVSALQNGDFAAARSAFLEVTGSGTGSPQAWLFLAQACEGLDDRDTWMSALDEVLKANPNNAFALLMKGDIFLRKGDDRAAVSFLRLGLKIAEAMPERPGDLDERMARAQAAVDAVEGRFDEHLKRTLAERGIRELPPRFIESLAIAAGRQPIYLQQPTSFYYPGLPQRPWYSADEFNWAAELEAASADMRAEIEAVLAADVGMVPYVEEHEERASRGHSLLNDARWSAFHLWKSGEVVEDNARRMPLTMKMLERPPLPFIKNRSPMAMISILRPGTHIPPHTGMLNSRLICHIPLVVPDNCRLRVGAETRAVVEGKAMIFDDSFEHEAWNDSDSVRAVLLFEIWRPELSEDERVALTVMYEAVTGYPSAQDG